MCSFHNGSDFSGYTEVLYHPKTDINYTNFGDTLAILLIWLVDAISFHISYHLDEYQTMFCYYNFLSFEISICLFHRPL